jgi:uncharacterized protein
VLTAVNHYWYQHPATEAELDAMAKPAADDSEDHNPPRQRSGHWVH